MATFVFAGKVLPISANFTMAGAINFHWENTGMDVDPAVKLVMDASLMIAKAAIEIRCE
jgi:hypothetical protein